MSITTSVIPGIALTILAMSFSGCASNPKSAQQPQSTITSVKANEQQQEAILEEALHSSSDVEKQLLELGENPNPTDLAKGIAEIDGWLIEPSSIDLVQKILEPRISQLRQQILDEVKIKHDSTLSAPSGDVASKFYFEAGSLIALFPMSDSPEIIEQARLLSVSHRNVGREMDVIKRVRYNHWAVDQIEKAIKGFHEEKDFLSPKKENPKLIKSLVNNLREVDPDLLEPQVVALYSYIIDKTKDKISESDIIQLIKQLTDPNVHRKQIKDF